MKSLLPLLSVILILALASAACTSTNNLTYCPNFKKKSKAPKALAFKFKKKQNNKHKAIVTKTKNINNQLLQTKVVKPLKSINAVAINNNSSKLNALTANNSINIKNYLNEKLAIKINEPVNIESAIASLKTIIEENKTNNLENLGVPIFTKTNTTKPLSKKEIKKLKKEVKKKTRTNLKDYRDSNAKKNDEFALASLISSITGLAIVILSLSAIPYASVFYVGFVLLLFGLVSGIIGLVRIKRRPELRKGKGFAIAGIIISGLVLLLIGIFLALFAIVGI